jgi:hypothetical protein
MPDTLSGGYSIWGRKLTIQLHVVPRLRMCAAIPPLAHISSFCGANYTQGQLYMFYFHLHKVIMLGKRTLLVSTLF